jgi:hypothetical protein
MLRQRARFRKLRKLVNRIFQKILRRHSGLGIDVQREVSGSEQH